MRVAKIALSADTAGFKTAIEDAKKSIAGLGNAKISNDSGNKLKALFSDQLLRSARTLKSEISSISDRLNNMGKSSAKLDVGRVTDYTKRLEELKGRLKEVGDAQDKLNKGQGGGGTGMFGGMGRVVSAAALGMGVSALMSRRNEMATGNMGIRQLTRDGGTVGDQSRMGFTPEERRERALTLAKATGGVDSSRLNGMTDLSEKVERAYGVTGDQTAETVGAARKAGVSDQGKFLSNAIGAAVASGLEGSKIGEYLGAMTGYMGSMSQGVDIDSKSLNGFAGAIGSIPFFKNDPSRIFDAIRSMNSTFQGGGAYETMQASQAIRASAPEASPGSINVRRKLGLFGGGDAVKGLAGRFRKMDGGSDLANTISVGGPQIVENMFKRIMAATKGMSLQNQADAFQTNTGLNNQQGLEIFADLKEGKKIDSKKLAEATMSPEDRLAKTMNNADATAKLMIARLGQIYDRMASDVAEPINKLSNRIDKLIGSLGGDTAAIGGAVGAGGVALGVAGTALGARGIKALGKGGERLAEAGAKGGLKGLGKAGGRMAAGGMKGFGKGAAKLGAHAGEAIPLIGAVVGAGFAIKDAYDIVHQYMTEGKVTGKAAAILGADLGAVFTGGFGGAAAAVASVGLEALPDDALGSVGGGTNPGVPEAGLNNVIQMPKRKGGAGAPDTIEMGGPSPGDTAGSGLEQAIRENTQATRENSMTAALTSRAGSTPATRGGALRPGKIAPGKGRH